MEKDYRGGPTCNLRINYDQGRSVNSRRRRMSYYRGGKQPFQNCERSSNFYQYIITVPT
uniref:Uncharacterized protein n=1 Tax=Physcomitrium patens TaxID=3218 RepID=A0A2K1IB40_PHYPA|nr:hypothetical protein PHYPA_031077 [Physcomitrium patens]